MKKFFYLSCLVTVAFKRRIKAFFSDRLRQDTMRRIAIDVIHQKAEFAICVCYLTGISVFFIKIDLPVHRWFVRAVSQIDPVITKNRIYIRNACKISRCCKRKIYSAVFFYEIDAVI